VSVRWLARRVHLDTPVENIDRFVRAANVGERRGEALHDLARRPAKLMLRAQQPFVVEGLT
jgi:hypothetical protein